MMETNGSDRLRRMMMAALDGELSPENARDLHESLAHDQSARAEWDRLRRVQEVTRTMTYRAPSDRIWQEYWASVYTRIERGVSWILISIGAIVLLSWGAWQVVHDVAAASLAWYLKLAIAALLVGLVILLVSVLREKIFMQRRNPYKDVTQ